MLPHLIHVHPHLRVELQTDPRLIDMVQEGVDLASRIGPLPDSSLIAKRLPSIQLLLLASPAYLSRRGTPADLSDLVDHDMITREPTSHWTFRKAGAEQTIEVSGRIIMPDAAAQNVVIEGGAGIGCLPSYLAVGGHPVRQASPPNRQMAAARGRYPSGLSHAPRHVGKGARVH